MTRSIALVFPQWASAHSEFGEEHAFHEFEHVVRAVVEVSPLVEVENLGTIVIAARGPSRYFGGDIAVAQQLDQICSTVAQGLPFGVGIADSRFAATAAAHLSLSRKTPCVIESAITTEFIDALPVASLARVGGITENTVDLLERLGLRRCGDVRAIGEVALIDRFGVDGKHVYALVSGSEVRHFVPGSPPSDFTRVMESESPLINAAHVVSAAYQTMVDMVEAIAAHGQQCVRLLITCHTDHAETTTRIWGEPRGFSTAGIAQRLSYQVSGWLVDADSDADGPTSGVVRVVFEPLECREVLVVQPLLWGGHQENTERAARAVAMASAVDDSVHITVPRWRGGRDIASVYEQVPVHMVDLSDAHDAEQRVHFGNGVARDWSGALPRPSPPSVATEPPIAEVLNADGRSVMVTGRHELDSIPVRLCVSGRSYNIVQVAGPWPVEERWWDARRRRRHVRLQVLVQRDYGATSVFLVGLENRTWTLLAYYD